MASHSFLVGKIVYQLYLAITNEINNEGEFTAEYLLCQEI